MGSAGPRVAPRPGQSPHPRSRWVSGGGALLSCSLTEPQAPGWLPATWAHLAKVWLTPQVCRPHLSSDRFLPLAFLPSLPRGPLSLVKPSPPEQTDSRGPRNHLQEPHLDTAQPGAARLGDTEAGAVWGVAAGRQAGAGRPDGARWASGAGPRWVPARSVTCSSVPGTGPQGSATLFTAASPSGWTRVPQKDVLKPQL